MPLSLDYIEQLKEQYTDRKVTVVEDRPELKRFAGRVGVIKTINMNGSALVEFKDYVGDQGWHDIPLRHLKLLPAEEGNS